MEEKLNPAIGHIGNALRSVAKDHITSFPEDIYDEHFHEYQAVINKLNSTQDEEGNLEKIPFKYIDEVDGTYQVFTGYICVQLVGENYSDPRLNIGADYHTIRLDKSSKGSIDYWYDKTIPFLLWQAEHQDVMILRRACDELNELKKAYLDNIDYIIH